MELLKLLNLGVPVPFAAAVVWLYLRVVKVEKTAEAAVKDLAEYKLEAADKYASIGYLKDVEERLVRVLERIEDRLNDLKHPTK